MHMTRRILTRSRETRWWQKKVSPLARKLFEKNNFAKTQFLKGKWRSDQYNERRAVVFSHLISLEPLIAFRTLFTLGALFMLL